MLKLQPVMLPLQGRGVDQECLQVAVLVVMAIKRSIRKETKSLERKKGLYLFYSNTCICNFACEGLIGFQAFCIGMCSY